MFAFVLVAIDLVHDVPYQFQRQLQALSDVPHRLASFGTWRDREARVYGTPEEHDRLFGVDAEGLAKSIADFVR